MIGNDIVDIAEAKKDSNWQRSRFLDKLFTSKEQQLVHQSKNSFLKVWRLWSMKEAAYKLYIQLYPGRFYNPKSFECVISQKSGIVKFQDFCCYVETKITSNYIISEARLHRQSMSSEVILFDSKMLKNQSQILKSKLLHRISQEYHIPITDLSVSKSEYGVPSVAYNQKHINLSLTHHGNYGAFAIA